jgi:ADP-ribose pyrophosphatase
MSGVDPLEETTLDSQLVYEGVFLNVHRDTVKAPDGHIAVREYLKHPGAVMIVPLFDDGSVLLERQYRYPLRRSFVEFPAGKIDAGESLLACAQRELLEETGYEAGEWTHLGGFHNAIGYCDEKIEVFLARGLARIADKNTDAGEVLEVFNAPWRELLDWTRDGTVTDVKTIVGVLWLRGWVERGGSSRQQGR